MKYKCRAFFVCLLLIAGAHSPSLAIQNDYTGNDRIVHQVWKLDLAVDPMGNDSFSVRFPYPDPNYKWVGRWDEYDYEEISIDLSCDIQGPFYWECTHYNEGYSNQGVWIEVFYPPSDITFHYRVKQSATLRLPGHDYAMQHFTNNGWMTGSYYVDVNVSIVGQDLSLAQQLLGDWEFRGYWKEPEQIVNWMRQQMTWSESASHIIQRASEILAQGYGDCDGWAHAACAMFLKAGIPAKTVFVGAMTGDNATDYEFSEAQVHVCAAYWDGFGWILIDPYFSSGFTSISRVILGADRDASTVMIITDPPDLAYYVQGTPSCEEGPELGSLHLWQTRSLQYGWDILENYELPDPQNVQGIEPQSCIVLNIPTVADITQSPRTRFVVNYPNPFNPVTTFKLNLQRDGRVRIDVFSIEGKLVATIADAFVLRGERAFEWMPTNLASGIYLAKVQTPDGSDMRKIVLLK